MAGIQLQAPDVSLEEPTFVEGFPGVGLVGKIATDHLIRELEMEYYASVDCEGLPRVGTYRAGEGRVRPPVRLYASEAHDLIALQSDVPIGSPAVGSVANCVSSWIAAQEARPIYLSGLPAEREEPPSLYGIATGSQLETLEDHGIATPPEDGVVSGPTGALLDRAAQRGDDSLGLIVDSSPQFPDPEAASVLLEEGIAPITDVSIDVEELVGRAEEIREKREQFARQMQQLSQEESSQAQPLRMYQ
ncbi:proteasome assembly chaperone family protein [Natronococcus sp. A-GB7]|uniref:proteasome assembly chaperone family protein n=1 Tax=Natronococcus sp. A-GB7 TaxID=3037649 RepID=UPI00241EB202|nr:proteasome assembly chaperone family protein [Natronococcus sp. A-GB7]MDG5818180.1 proteasome assembly chaperone family protein [Natronococcus sp. A-GB7]